jgi:hypothetical protein
MRLWRCMREGRASRGLIELANPKPSWRVLNIATGASHTALAFAPLVARVTAGRQQ